MRNKSILIFGVMAALSLALNASAQNTNTPNLMPPLPLQSTNPGVLGQLEGAAKSGYNILKSDSFTNGFQNTLLFAYQGGNVGFIDEVNTANTNGINYGFFIAGMQSKTSGGNKTFSLYDGGVALSASGTYNIPFIGTAQLTAEAGAVDDLADPLGGIYNEDTATAYKEFWASADGNVIIGGTVGIGYSTEWQDKPIYLAGITVTDLLKGTGFLGLW